jgi:hypothetical protein
MGRAGRRWREDGVVEHQQTSSGSWVPAM